MGQDIHCYGEIRIDGLWHNYLRGNFRRNYSVFSKMGSERDPEIKPIVEQKGLPEDCGKIAKIAYEDMAVDFHHMSWFDLNEINQLWDYCAGLQQSKVLPDNYLFYAMGWLFGNYWQDFAKYRSNYPQEIEQIRWVFWFDS